MNNEINCSIKNVGVAEGCYIGSGRRSLYEILGVAPDATLEQIKEGFEKSLENCISSKKKQKLEILKINQAYNALTCPVEKYIYDFQNNLNNPDSKIVETVTEEIIKNGKLQYYYYTRDRYFYHVVMNLLYNYPNSKNYKYIYQIGNDKYNQYLNCYDNPKEKLTPNFKNKIEQLNDLKIYFMPFKDLKKYALAGTSNAVEIMKERKANGVGKQKVLK